VADREYDPRGREALVNLMKQKAADTARANAASYLKNHRNSRRRTRPTLCMRSNVVVALFGVS
jgi:hypothetical protein